MAVPSLFTQISTWLTVAAAAVCVLAIACSDDAAPGECIDSAERAGVPDAVIDWMKQPSDELGSIERVAIREALEKFGLGEACSEVADNLGLAINGEGHDLLGHNKGNSNGRADSAGQTID